jgi:hypothetical protein
MSKPLVKDTQDLDLNAQSSNKTGKHSSAAKPSNAGPDAHSEHKAPVDGAFGAHLDEAKDSNDTPLGQWVPSDKHNKK